jgi:predicted dehydrogenase
MRVGILGLGSAGRRHGRNALALGHEVIAYDPRCVGRLPVNDDWCGKVSFAPSASALLTSQLDSLIICTPPAQHALDTMAALEYGLRLILVEKPFTLSVEAALVVCEGAYKVKAVLGCAFMLRAHPALLKAQGFKFAVGRIQEAKFVCRWQPKPSTYAWAGVIQETCHEIDLAIAICGPATLKQVFQADDRRYAWLQLQHHAGTMSELNLTARPETEYLRWFDLTGPGQRTYYDDLEDMAVMDQCYVDELRAFLSGKPLCSWQQAIQTVQIVEEAEKMAALVGR